MELAFATPRLWLRDGGAITVRNAPTSFGPISYTIERRGDQIHATIDSPPSRALQSLRIRLRLPAGDRLARLGLQGSEVAYEAATETIDLPTHGHLELDASVESSLSAIP